MAFEIDMVKNERGVFVPLSPEDYEKTKCVEFGRVVRVTITLINNWKFHKKLMALIRFAFLNMPETKHKKSFEVFRNDLLVLAGHYEQIFSLNGKGFKLVAKSLKYSKMNDLEKQTVYNDVCQVILERVLNNYTLQELFDCVDEKTTKFAGFL